MKDRSASLRRGRYREIALLAAYGSGFAIAGYMALCVIVTIVSTAMMPDYTNQDISEEHDNP